MHCLRKSKFALSHAIFNTLLACLYHAVETIGDAYMCVSNLKFHQPDCHAARMAQFAFGCLAAANETPVCLDKPGVSQTTKRTLYSKETLHLLLTGYAAGRQNCLRKGLGCTPTHKCIQFYLAAELGCIHVRIGIHTGPVMGAVVSV